MKVFNRALRATKRGGLKYTAVKIVDGILKPVGIHLESFLFDYISDEFLTIKNIESLSIQDRFTHIFKTNYWSSAESVSGPGSEITNASMYSSELKSFLSERRITEIFDAPCGDFNWMSKLLQDCSIQYRGGDIVEELVERNRRLFPNFEFLVFDITRDKFPSAEVWHCRDCLFHLSYLDIRRALENFVTSDIQFALITTYRSLLLKNRDIRTGYFRYTDLERHPFNFPRPSVYLRDFRLGVDFPRYVALWDRGQIKQALGAWNGGAYSV